MPESNLFNDKTFYPAFARDVLAAKREVIIYSPFVSKLRADSFERVVSRAVKRGVRAVIFTRSPEEYPGAQRERVRLILERYELIGAEVRCLRGGIHEKAAMIDREILWEGSLIILSQWRSREMMRRTANEGAVAAVLAHLGLERKLEGRPKLLSTMAPRPKSRSCLFTILLVTLSWWTAVWVLDSISAKDLYSAFDTIRSLLR